VITRRTGFVAGAALAAGLALGFAGSALAAGPTASAGHGSMMGGGGMMGGLSGEQSQQMLERCDQIHDALHASPSASESPASR
jgi:Spy/CpxP family protein refolding chaperone